MKRTISLDAAADLVEELGAIGDAVAYICPCCDFSGSSTVIESLEQCEHSVEFFACEQCRSLLVSHDCGPTALPSKAYSRLFECLHSDLADELQRDHAKWLGLEVVE